MNMEHWFDSELCGSTDDKLFLGLFTDILAELSDEKKKWRQDVLENSHDSIQTTVDKDSPHDRLKDISEDLWCFKWFDLIVVKLEVSVCEGKGQVLFDIHLGVTVKLGVIEDHILMEA